jgi:hypothetical protein
MRLSCQKTLLLVAAVTMACHESTAPPQTVSKLYVLETINGQPLPAVLNAGQGDTTRVVWGTVILYSAGNAFTAEHWRRVYPPNPSEEGILSLQREYRIAGDNITVGSFTPCPINAICEGNKVGKLTSSTLTLAYEHAGAPVYLYQLAHTD